MGKELVDSIFQGRAYGGVAQRLLASGMNVNALRPFETPTVNATLRKEEWKRLDEAVVDISVSRMTGVNDLVSRGLTYDIANGLGTTVLEYEDMSDMTDAEVSMDAASPPGMDRIKYEIKYLPLPIFHKEFMLNIRTLNASRTRGMSLDITQGQVAARKVAEKIETVLFAGSSTFTYGGGILYGYEDFPSRITGSLTDAWDESNADPVADIIAMKQASISAKHFGPWVAYVPTAYETVLDEDYTTNYAVTYRERILKIGGIQDVKVADFKTDGSVLLVEMVPETIRMVMGLQPTTVEWETLGGMITHYKVMSIMVPQPRADQDGNCGIVHYSEP
jgi:hypothetical protein